MTTTYDLSNPEAPTIIKDPNAVLDYSFDWSKWLTGGDSIVSHLIIAEAPLTATLGSAAAGMVTTFVSGGDIGKARRVTCRITTAQGRTDDRTIYLRIRER